MKAIGADGTTLRECLRNLAVQFWPIDKLIPISCQTLVEMEAVTYSLVYALGSHRRQRES